MNLTDYLSQKTIVLATEPIARQLAENIYSRSDKSLKIMYGETYDQFGLVLDSLKYYFCVANIGRVLHKMGIEVTPHILIADVATCRNLPEEYHHDYMQLGQKRYQLLESIIAHFQLRISPLLMSEYLFSVDFQNQLNSVKVYAQEHQEIYEWVKRTVPQDKVAIEAEKGFAYAFEEIATIMNYDIKVGPPREKFYDEPSRRISQIMGVDELQSVYLHPTYPLGMKRSFFMDNEEIEQFGVTPYKAGSKGLNNHRVILGKTSKETLIELVSNSVISKKEGIPNPILDLIVIAEMARQWQNQSFEKITLREDFYSSQLDVAILKQRAIDTTWDYIINPLHKLVESCLS